MLLFECRRNKFIEVCAHLFTFIFKKIFFLLERKIKKKIQETPDLYVKNLFHNPLVVAQVKEELIFEPDYLLGHASPKGKEFIGREKFLSFKNVIQQASGEKKSIILNLGDSSTSGWDSRVVTHNRLIHLQGKNDIHLPFFQYKTYSDYLRESLKDFLVINAGIPAFSSFQGVRYLALLLDAFKRHGVQVAAVSVYFGNNDSCWNGNREDIKLLPKSINSLTGYYLNALFEESLFAKFLLAEHLKRKGLPNQFIDVIPRVPLQDYRFCIQAIIELCSNRGIQCILIEPVIPLLWEPGKRFDCDDFYTFKEPSIPGASAVYSMLSEAQRLWENGNQKVKNRYVSQETSWILENAVDLDFVIPRIKKAYLRELKLLATKHSIPYVRIDIPHDHREKEYILDYCHPMEPANIVIAERIYECLDLNRITYKCSKKNACQEFDEKFMKYKKGQKNFIPGRDDIYPLY